MRHQWRAGTAALAFVSLGFAGAAFAVTQTYTGDIITMTVNDRAAPSIRVKPSTLVPNSYVTQYYGNNSWGSGVRVAGVTHTTGYFTGTRVTPVSNTLNVTGSGGQIVTVANLGTTGLRLTQTFTYENGTRFVSKQWEIRNTNVSGPALSNVRFYHGGDTYFGDEDSAYSFHDPSNGMVYVRNNDYTNWGLMGFVANPATPASGYFAGSYGTVHQSASAGTALPNRAEAAFTDAGYALQWDRATLAPGEAWTIEATEVWTPGGGLQVLAPSSQNVANGSTVTLPFTVQNLAPTPITVNLLAASDDPLLAASLPAGNTATIDANASASVNVTVAVASGATGSAQVTLTAESGASASAAVTLSVVNLSLDVWPSQSIGFGSIPVGSQAAAGVLVHNTSTGPVTLGSASAIAPFGRQNDNCSGVTLAPNQSCTVEALFQPVSAGDFSGTFNLPVVSPLILTRTVALSGSAILLVNATCGPAQGGIVTAAPSSSLCTAGSPSGVAASAGDFAWTCNGIGGGTNASCTAPRAYLVTPSATGNGSISPATAQAVVYGNSASFTVTPAPGNSVAVTGSCGATLSGNAITTAAVTSDCAVNAAFAWIPLAQVIVFPLEPGRTLGDASLALNVAATSGLAVSIATLTPAVCRISGVTVTIDGAGTCTLRATQPGDSIWAAAPTVERSFEVARASVRMTLAASPNPARANQPVRILVTVEGGIGSVDGTLYFKMNGVELPGCRIVPLFDGRAQCVTRDLPPGVRILTADFEGNARYGPATSSEVSQYVKAFLRGSFRDFNGDGRTDLVLRHPSGETVVRLVTNTVTHDEAQLLPAGTPWTVTHFGDFDGNAKADLVLRHASGEIAVRLMDGTTAVGTIVIAPATEPVTVVEVGDFDGDGRDDLLVRNAAGRLEIRSVDGERVKVLKELPAALSAMAVRLVGDFDGDGRDDLLLDDGEALSVQRMDGANAGKRSILPAPVAGLELVLAADFDGDARSDLLFRRPDGSLLVWRAEESLVPGLSEAWGPTDWKVTGTGDFDGDGGEDLVLVDAAGQVAVWLMEGTRPGLRSVLYGPTEFRVALVGDFNADGISDLLLAGPQNELVIWIMVSNAIHGAWTPHHASEWKLVR